MATPKAWKNVAVAMQSALAASVTISAITKASPPVATATAHGYSNGDILYLSINGMHQLNEKVIRVANKTNDTFEIEGEDSTLYETFSSGGAEKITFGTSIVTATDLSASGGEYDYIDTTTIHASQKTQIPGLPSPTAYAMTHIWDPSDPGQIAMKIASQSQAVRAFRFTFGAGGAVLYFAGNVGYSGTPGGSAQVLITCSSTITQNGTSTSYAS